MTKQERAAFAHVIQYERSTNYSLDDCYGRYSSAKIAAWQYCVDLCRKYDGYNLKIITYNCMMFTAGFTYEDAETGVVKFMYITRDYDVSIDYPDVKGVA